MSTKIETWILEEASVTSMTQGRTVGCERYGSGHINSIFKLVCDRLYILQRVNDEIFRDPVSLTRDIEGVTIFLRREVIKNGGDPDQEILNLVKTKKGEAFYVDSRGSYWRVYLFIEGATCYNLVERPENPYQGGKAFGHFQRLLSWYPAKELSETIPGFYDVPRGFQRFQEVVDQDICNRAGQVREEIRLVADRGGGMDLAMDILASGALPLRVIHNDTKLNNIMIDDSTGQAICIVDLDTVMPGLSTFDFGNFI